MPFMSRGLRSMESGLRREGRKGGVECAVSLDDEPALYSSGGACGGDTRLTRGADWTTPRRLIPTAAAIGLDSDTALIPLRRRQERGRQDRRRRDRRTV